MHLCTAIVAIAGDVGQQVYRTPFTPISLPEVNVLRYLHGDSAVQHIKPFADVQQTARDERDRLARIYGAVVGEAVYPGYSPNMDMTLIDAELDPTVTSYFNPVTDKVVGALLRGPKDPKDEDPDGPGKPDDDDDDDGDLAAAGKLPAGKLPTGKPKPPLSRPAARLEPFS